MSAIMEMFTPGQDFHVGNKTESMIASVVLNREKLNRRDMFDRKYSPIR